MKQKKALIFGVTGQDGYYLSKLLLEKNYLVHGVKRKSSSFNTKRVDQLFTSHKSFFLHYGDLTDFNSILNLLKKIKPEEIYNLGAMSHVKTSFEIPNYTTQANSIGVLNILESIRAVDLEKHTKFYQASSSEMFGNSKSEIQNEKTLFKPNSPYAVSKLFSYWTTINYRNGYGIFACNGILFNHESPFRGETFVTKKITMGIAKILSGSNQIINLGNLDAKRDWGHAEDYSEAIWLIMQHKNADDWVISTGTNHSIRDLIKTAFEVLDIEVEFIGKAESEVVKIKSCKNRKYQIEKGRTVIKVNPKYYRPNEVHSLKGDSSKAKKILNWTPKRTFKQLIEEMLMFDISKKNYQ